MQLKFPTSVYDESQTTS